MASVGQAEPVCGEETQLSATVAARRAAASYWAVTATVVLAFVVVTWHYFGSLFLLIEYRQQALSAHLFNPLTIFAPGTLFDSNAFSVAFSKSFTTLTQGFVEAVCGRDGACHDRFQILLLAGAALLLAATLRQLFPRAPALLAVGAVIFLLFAIPVWDSLTWQATIYDKLALFLTAAATYVAARVALDSLRAGKVLAFNAGMLLLVFAAYNSKEGAPFALFPSLLILLTFRFLEREAFLTVRAMWRSVRGALLMLAAPGIYAVFHVAAVFVSLSYLTPADRARLVAGSIPFNFYHDVVYFFNLEPLARAAGFYPYAPPAVLIGFLSASIAAACLLAAFLLRIAPRRLALMWAWSVLSFLLAFAIPIRTAGISPFYLLVPLYYLSLSLFATAAIAWNAARSPLTRQLTAVVVALFVACHVAGLWLAARQFTAVSEMSENFVSALDRVKGQLQSGPRPVRVTFFWPRTQTRAYLFVGTPQMRTIAPYILPGGTPQSVIDSFDAAIDDRAYSPPFTARAGRGDFYVVLGNMLQMEKIVTGRAEAVAP